MKAAGTSQHPHKIRQVPKRHVHTNPDEPIDSQLNHIVIISTSLPCFHQLFSQTPILARKTFLLPPALPWFYPRQAILLYDYQSL